LTTSGYWLTLVRKRLDRKKQINAARSSARRRQARSQIKSVNAPDESGVFLRWSIAFVSIFSTGWNTMISTSPPTKMVHRNVRLHSSRSYVRQALKFSKIRISSQDLRYFVALCDFQYRNFVCNWHLNWVKLILSAVWVRNMLICSGYIVSLNF
jgi:hypothetical protein